jgi:hypothetical protein
MPRTCTVCTSLHREVVDKTLVRGEDPFRTIADRFGLSTTALKRHKAEHLPQTIVKARESEDVAHAIDIIRQLKAINGATLQILNEARAAGNGELVLKAVDRVERQITLQAKLLGDLSDQPQINILASPEWITLRSTLISVLCDFPDAQAAVIARLQPPEHSPGRAS